MVNFKCDFHIHSTYSDGRLSISEIVDLYGKNGFDAIAITDHICERNNLIGKVSHQLNICLSKENFDHYINAIKIEAKRAWQRYRMLLIPGYEITKNSFYNHRSAHILVLGVEKFIDPDLDPVVILKQARELGGLTIAAHPFNNGKFEFQSFYLWSRRQSLLDLVDAWEMNNRDEIQVDVFKSGLPIVANSDFHDMRHFKTWLTKVYSRELSQEALFGGIRKQKIDFFLHS